jgi:hypothetical protein
MTISVQWLARKRSEGAFFGRPRELRTRHNMAHDISGIEQNFERRV